jgi:hypothetical protein
LGNEAAALSESTLTLIDCERYDFRYLPVGGFIFPYCPSKLRHKELIPNFRIVNQFESNDEIFIFHSYECAKCGTPKEGKKSRTFAANQLLDFPITRFC